MEISKQCISFWAKVEKVTGPIPAHIKNTMCFAGFQSAFTIKEITSDNMIDNISKVAKEILDILQGTSNDKTTHIGEQEAVLKLFFGMYYTKPESFKFQVGEKLLIRKVATLAKDESIFNVDDNEPAGHAAMTKTIIGRIFGKGNVEGDIARLSELTLRDEEADSREEADDEVQALCSKYGDGSVFLKLMNDCFERNVDRHAQGQRYDMETKYFAAYTRMLGGRKNYITMKANTTYSVPSLTSIDRFIHKQITGFAKEGEVRGDALCSYLRNLGLPLKVCLSEDATGITGRIEYHRKTNQVIGFTLPLDKNGMPIVNSYPARSAAEIESYFYDRKTKNERHPASLINIVMAQPLSKLAPPFCVMVFGTNGKYKASEVQRRWSFITEELKKNGIEVISWAADSDPRFNCAMTRLLQLGTLQPELPPWFNARFDRGRFIPFQDVVHIGTKLRNRLLNHQLQFGTHIITVNHLQSLLRSVSKTEHNLSETTINPKDRQNFDSVLKICNEKCIQLLATNINKSEGTVFYLKIMDKILRAFLDRRLTPLERIRHLWVSTFLLRIWKEFVVSSPRLKIEKHFISTYCYACVEINAHSLVMYISYLKQFQLDHRFDAEFVSSQPCENMFRSIRSFTSTFSTITNCSLLGIIQRMSKIEMLNEISHISLKRFNFPRVGDTNKSYYPEIDRNGCMPNERKGSLPSLDEIFAEIELAKIEALEYAESLGVRLTGNNNLACQFKTTEDKAGPFDPPNPPEIPETEKDRLKFYPEINLANYEQKVDPDSIKEEDEHVKVFTLNKTFSITKHTLIWLLSKTTTKLSSDRLLRVMGIDRN